MNSRYHIGFFRQLQQEGNNNQIPPAGAAVDANDAVNVGPEVAVADGDGVAAAAVPAADGAAAQAASANAAVDSNAPSTGDIVAEDQNNRTPVIALIRTFILSFFASLIPETPAL